MAKNREAYMISVMRVEKVIMQYERHEMDSTYI